jgi:hypothetical protein
MFTADSRHDVSTRRGGSRKIRPAAYVVVGASLVAAVVAMAVADGTTGAVLSALVAFATAGTVVGVWGTAMAVRDTHELSSRPESERSKVPVPGSPSLR